MLHCTTWHKVTPKIWSNIVFFEIFESRAFKGHMDCPNRLIPWRKLVEMGATFSHLKVWFLMRNWVSLLWTSERGQVMSSLGTWPLSSTQNFEGCIYWMGWHKITAYHLSVLVLLVQNYGVILVSANRLVFYISPGNISLWSELNCLMSKANKIWPKCIRFNFPECAAYLLLIDHNRTYPEEVQPTIRSEEHTSELQSHSDLVCRLLLEKKKKQQQKKKQKKKKNKINKKITH